MIGSSLSRLLLIVCVAVLPAAAWAKDPLPSWKEGANKQAIIAFVTAVTTQGDAFVPATDRIATFDMDGTILVEKPQAVLLEFSRAFLAEVARKNPDLATQPYKAMREKDEAYFGTNLVEVITSAGIGMSEEDFRKAIRSFANTATHPRYAVPFGKLFYAPMLELIDYLRANDFRVYVVSGSTQCFVRGVAREATGLPYGQLLGTQIALYYYKGDFTRSGTFRDLTTVSAGKPLIIEYQIGQRPIFAFGNTSGDQDMLEYALGNQTYRSLALWLDHDDAEREYAYDSGVKDVSGLLKVSMKNDFARLFREE